MFEAIVYALFAPFILLLLSSFWIYPAVLEEVVKWTILKKSNPSIVGQYVGILVGLAFGLSETVLYTFGVWSSGDWQLIVRRLCLTVPMHMVTAGIIGYSLRKGYGLLGLLIAMVIHGAFNYFVMLIA